LKEYCERWARERYIAGESTKGAFNRVTFKPPPVYCPHAKEYYELFKKADAAITKAKYCKRRVTCAERVATKMTRTREEIKQIVEEAKTAWHEGRGTESRYIF
jgi:hypothetical protein